MSIPIPLHGDFNAAQLRGLAKKTTREKLPVPDGIKLVYQPPRSRSSNPPSTFLSKRAGRLACFGAAPLIAGEDDDRSRSSRGS